MVVNRLFPLWCVVSLALPFGLGWFFGGVAGGLTALLWAGGVRICLLHHVTWSINSICHTLGRRPFATTDRSTNVGALAVFSFGESWHNGHHAFPAPLATGCFPISGLVGDGLIGLFERAGSHGRRPRCHRARRAGLVSRRAGRGGHPAARG